MTGARAGSAEAADGWVTRLMAWARGVPGLGILLALLSGICFATAGFTVELMRGVDGSANGAGVDASLIVVCR